MKGKQLKKIIIALAAAASITLAVTGCKSGGSVPSGVSSSVKAQLSVAPSTEAYDKQQAQRLARQCLPNYATVTGLVEYKTLLSRSKGQGDRAKVVACMGIPQAKRAAAEQEFLLSGEQALADQVFKHKKGALQAYATGTVPQIIVKYKYGK